jgi:hypothetical protein
LEKNVPDFFRKKVSICFGNFFPIFLGKKVSNFFKKQVSDFLEEFFPIFLKKCFQIYWEIIKYFSLKKKQFINLNWF